MTSVEVTQSLFVHPPACPFCGHPTVSRVERTVRTVFIGDYMCAEGHVWMLKTVTGQ